MTTPHIAAAAGEFAETVLLPGDPLRARHIAQALLDDARLVTDVRAMAGYTGTWRGRRVSVMGSGMGIPSCAIYATELVRHYGVRRLIRVGTCGAVHADVRLGDLVVAMGASTDSRVNRLRFRDYDLAALASFPLLRRVADRARDANTPLHVGNVFSTDSFHHPDDDLVGLLARHGVLGIEMEAAGLYGLAAALGVQALAVLTVSDVLHAGDAPGPRALSATERTTGVDAMTRLVLDAIA